MATKIKKLPADLENDPKFLEIFTKHGLPLIVIAKQKRNLNILCELHQTIWPAKLYYIGNTNCGAKVNVVISKDVQADLVTESLCFGDSSKITVINYICFPTPENVSKAYYKALEKCREEMTESEYSAYAIMSEIYRGSGFENLTDVQRKALFELMLTTIKAIKDGKSELDTSTESEREACIRRVFPRTAINMSKHMSLSGAYEVAKAVDAFYQSLEVGGD